MVLYSPLLGPLGVTGSELVLILISWSWVSACHGHGCAMAQTWFSNFFHVSFPADLTINPGL